MIIFKQSLKRIFKSKVKFAVLLVAPFLFILMFGFQTQHSFSIGIIDKDNTKLSSNLIQSIQGIEKVKVVTLEDKNLLENTANYNVEYSIIIEKGFEEKLLTGNKPTVNEYYITEKEKLFYVRAYTDNYINNLETIAKGVGYDRTKFEVALEQYDNNNLDVSDKSADNNKIPQTRISLGFLVQFMLYMSIITAGLILEDKSNGQFFRIFYAPIRLSRYVCENLLAFIIVAIMQVSFVFLMMKYVLGMDFGGNDISLYALFIAFAVTCISFGVWVVSIFKKPIQAYTVVALATTPLVMIGACYWPYEWMPDIMKKIGTFVPTTWVMKGVDTVLYEAKGLGGIAINILVLLIFAAIFLAAGLIKKVDVAK